MWRGDAAAAATPELSGPNASQSKQEASLERIKIHITAFTAASRVRSTRVSHQITALHHAAFKRRVKRGQGAGPELTRRTPVQRTLEPETRTSTTEPKRALVWVWWEGLMFPSHLAECWVRTREKKGLRATAVAGGGEGGGEGAGLADDK